MHRTHRLFPFAALGSLLLALVACAPALEAPAEPVVLSAAQIGGICAANPRVTEGGVLLWGAEGEEASLPGPYDVTCPDAAFSHSGGQVTVRAATLAEALARFTEDAFLLSYYADLRVRLPEPGVVTADPPASVPEALRDDLGSIEVTVTPQGGESQRLLAGGQLTPRRFDPALLLTVQIRTRRTSNPWPVVVLDPRAGVVQATLGR